MNMTAPLTLGTHHVGLTVPDLDAAIAFFCEALGFALVGENPDYPCAFVSDGTTLITFWRAADSASAVRFDRKGNIGLHHLAFKVADEVMLANAFARVSAHPGVAIEFGPGPIRAGSAVQHFICAMPGGIRLEFATPFV
jgi:catechol 2,3-dioxygenase-like lactoylglutathione lyase family enzyme